MTLFPSFPKHMYHRRSSWRVVFFVGMIYGWHHPGLSAQEQQSEPISNQNDFQDFGELKLEDLLGEKVTAVSKQEQTIAEAPATVSVLSREDFEQNGWLNVAEALDSVPGMYMSWGRDYFYPGVRGVSLPLDKGTRILVLLDGHTMNNPWSAAGNLGELFTLPAEAIERVEIIPVRPRACMAPMPSLQWSISSPKNPKTSRPGGGTDRLGFLPWADTDPY